MMCGGISVWGPGGGVQITVDKMTVHKIKSVVVVWIKFYVMD